MNIAITSSPTPIHVNAPGATYMAYGRPSPAAIPTRGRGRGRGRGTAQRQVTQRQVTPPFLYLQRPNGSPSSDESASLPPNHIHIVQTNPQIHRTNSAFSNNSLPPLSNGQTSTEGSFAGTGSYQTSPNQSHDHTRILKDEQSLTDPIERISAFQAITHFANGLSRMQGGTYDEWLTFIDEHFEQNARFQLITCGETLKSFDILASSLPRFFMAFHVNGLIQQRLMLSDPPENHSARSIEYEHVEWHFGDKVWKGNLFAEIGPNFKLDKLELILENVHHELPDDVIRVLDISQQMECMMEVMDLVENQKINPNDALNQLIESEL